MFDVKSRPNILLITVLLTVVIVSAGFAFQVIGLPSISACLFSTSMLLLILVSYLGRMIMVTEPPPKQPFSKSSLDTATLSLNVLWIELIAVFIFFIILKVLNFYAFIINYVFALLFFTAIVTEVFTIFAYTKGYVRLKPTTKNIPIILTVANLIIIILSILTGFNIFLSSSEWGFMFSFSIFVTIPCVAKYLEMPKNKEILAGVSKEEVFKGKAIVYLAVSLTLPSVIFPVCYFIIPSLKLPYVEWWYIAIVLLSISELYPVMLIHRQLKKVKKMRVVQVRSFENVVRISIIVASVLLGILFAVLYAQSSMTKTGVAFESGSITFLSVSILFFTGPPSFYEYFRFKKVDRMEEKFPDFLRDLAEYWKGGLSMSSAVGTLAKGEYGALTGEVKKMATQVSWGVSFHEVLRMFSGRIKSPLVSRSVALIEEADKAGGKISDVLVTASNDAREIKWLQLERKRNTSSYVTIVYVSFFVYLGIVGVMAGLFIPAIVSSTEGISGGMGGVAMGTINVSLTVFLFFCSALIQGIGNGIVGGLLGDGKIVSGLRHGFIMMLITWLTFIFVICPMV